MKYFVGLCFLTCSVVPGFGATISFAPSPGVDTNQGTTHTYGGILATGYKTSGTLVDMFSKNDGSGEAGLGIANPNGVDNEIIPGTFIQLDISSFHGDALTFLMSSVTGTDAFSVFQSNTAKATSGTTCNSGCIAVDTYLDFTATGANGDVSNVLLNSLTYTQATPEPLSLALTGSGLLGLFLLRRRKSGSS